MMVSVDGVFVRFNLIYSLSETLFFMAAPSLPRAIGMMKN